MELFKEDFHKEYNGYWYNLIVPINEQGAREILIEPVESIVTENMDYLLFTEPELEVLMPLFNIFNAHFDIIIDTTENEILEFEHLQEAKELTKLYLDTLESEKKNTVLKLLAMLDKALEHHTFLWVYL